MNQDFYKMRFDGIQTLRGIAAVMVVMEHIRFLACGATIPSLVKYIPSCSSALRSEYTGTIEMSAHPIYCCITVSGMPARLKFVTVACRIAC